VEGLLAGDPVPDGALGLVQLRVGGGHQFLGRVFRGQFGGGDPDALAGYQASCMAMMRCHGTAAVGHSG